MLYALAADWPPDRTRPTLQLFFLGINAVALITIGLPNGFPLGLAVGLAVGVLAGPRVATRMAPDRVRRWTLVLAATGGGLAMARGLF